MSTTKKVGSAVLSGGKINRVILWILTLTVALPMQAMADDGQLLKMVQDMQEQMMKMQYTIEQQNTKIRDLQGRGPQVSAAPSAGGEAIPMSDYEFNERLANATGGANKWLKDLSFKGDLRLRYEAFRFKSGHPSETDDRTRFRYRLRYGFEKKFSDEIKIGFSMNSGEATNGQSVDPTSANTTFDNLFNYKDIFIEKAFAEYKPAWAKRGPIKQVKIKGGKMDNPFEKGSSDLIWDRDVKPEGAAEMVDIALIDSENFDLSSFATAGQFILDEDSTTGDGDAELYGYQLGVNAVAYTPYLERPVDITSAVSYYDYSDYAIRSNFLIGTTSLTRGNLNTAGTAAELDSQHFKVFDYYTEVAFYPGGLPIRPFIDVATNTAQEADSFNDEDLAWALGAKIGGIVKKGDWELSYAYKRIESESVVGAFNDSDFGLGHSGKRGSVIKAGYALTDSITAGAAAFFVNNTEVGTFGVRDEAQNRFQLDLAWKF